MSADDVKAAVVDRAVQRLMDETAVFDVVDVVVVLEGRVATVRVVDMR